MPASTNSNSSASKSSSSGTSDNVPVRGATMNAASLKDLHERRVEIMRRRPSLGRGTAQACAHLSAGFICDVHDEDRVVRLDLPLSDGGSDEGPQPEQLMRASLGAALAMGYRSWGVRLGTQIDAVDIEVACEYDVRGQMGLDPAVAVGWQRVVFHVAVISPDSEAAVREVVETADRLNPILANLAASIERVHRLTILRPADSRARERNVP